MSSINKIYIVVIVLFCSLLFIRLSAQSSRASGKNLALAQQDTTQHITEAPVQDTTLPLSTPGDSLVIDSLRLLEDTTTVKEDSLTPPKKSALDAVIEYKANDSAVFMGNNMAYMYGSGVVSYQDIELDADEIRMNMDSALVYAVGREDTAGEMVGNPVFKDKSGEYNSTTLQYNFRSQKGYITNIITQQGEGYLTGGKAKKMQGDEFYMVDGKYTTCDDHECPHFYLQLTKAKVRPKKNIVMGPAYMVLAGVPLPLVIPFGFFPFTDKYSSGILMPTVGDELARGFYLRDGGYYFAISDYMDLALTGEIYTKGSWGVSAQSNYIKRYKFSGNFNASFITTIYGDKGMPDYSKQKNFRVTWNHSQDTKSNPNMTFSSSVNFATSGYNRNDLNSYYNANSFTENTKSSTINLTYRFPESPFSISATTNITQRSSDSTLAVSFPDLTFNMAQVYPFKRKNPIGKERWYEKIQLSYTGLFRNSITTNQDEFFKSSLIKDWNNGLKHTVPISATFSLLKYINVTPSISLTDWMYSRKVMQQWDTQDAAVVRDTAYGFYNILNYSFSVSAQTKLYGFYTPLPFLGDKIQQIRHVFTPSVSFSAAPDFGNPNLGYWQTYSYFDKTGERIDRQYSPFEGGIFGTSQRGKQGVVSFSVSNNLEMKVKSDRDTSGIRKISLIENLSANMSYNMAADSMRWSNINTGINIRLTKGFNLQLNAVFDTYTYKLINDRPVRVNIPRWQAGKGLGRLSSTGTSFSYTLSNETFKKLKKGFSKEDDENLEAVTERPDNVDENSEPEEASKTTSSESDLKFKDGYMVWSVPWSLSINYSINYGYGEFNKKKLEYDGKITQNLSFSGNISPTKNWSFNFSTSYDFDRKKIAYMNCGITRDLHCFSMSANFIPVGPYKSYNFHISVKSSLLQDLKYDKRSNAYERSKWY